MPQACSADEFGELVECQTKNENATNYGDTCTVAYIGMYFLSILFWSQFSYPEIYLNTFLNVIFSAYIVRFGFPLWVRGCIFVENPSGQPYLGCHKMHNQTMEIQGCVCQENGCNKELKEPSGIFKSHFATNLTYDIITTRTDI